MESFLRTKTGRKSKKFKNIEPSNKIKNFLFQLFR
jgi:hypothetical protein